MRPISRASVRRRGWDWRTRLRSIAGEEID